MRNVKTTRVECYEIWSFVYAKAKNVEAAKTTLDGPGDVWTWTAIGADSKMILSYEVGDRSGDTAYEFMVDLASRLSNRVQLTTDGHKVYLDAVEGAFGGDRQTTQCLLSSMAAGVSETLHDTAWIVGLIDANAPAPKKRGPYKKKDNSN